MVPFVEYWVSVAMKPGGACALITSVLLSFHSALCPVVDPLCCIVLTSQHNRLVAVDLSQLTAQCIESVGASREGRIPLSCQLLTPLPQWDPPTHTPPPPPFPAKLGRVNIYQPPQQWPAQRRKTLWAELTQGWQITWCQSRLKDGLQEAQDSGLQ